MMNHGNEGNSSNVRGRRSYHTPEQRQRLEEVFNIDPNPTRDLQQTLSEELNLEPKQIKSWFQNRRTRKKIAANAEAKNLEFERMSEEIQKLRAENIRLKQEHERCPKTIDYIPANENSESQLALILDTQLSPAITGTPNTALQQVSPHSVIMPDRKAIVVNLARRMSESFWKSFPNLPDMGSDEVRVSIRPIEGPDVQSHFVLGACASLFLDVSRVTLHDFFNNEQTRCQWDVYTAESSTKVIEDIYLGGDPRDRVLMYQVSRRSENLFILQESSNTALGSAVVYAPLHLDWVRSVWSGVNPTGFTLLPVGLTISGDASSQISAAGSSSTSMPGHRSLVTIYFQMLPSSASEPDINGGDVALIENIVTTTMQRIRAAFSG